MSSVSAATISNTALKIVAHTPLRRELILSNNSNSATVYIGIDSSLTAANGLPVYPNQSYVRSRDTGTYLGDIYAICGTGSTADVRIWEITT